MSSGVDCTVLRDLYGTSELRATFESEALVQGWLDAERALAEAEAVVGIIPTSAAEIIAANSRASLYDLDELRSGVAASQHPLIPLIRALARRCGESAGAYVHWGATTQDIIDTGLVLQVRAALTLIRADAMLACELMGRLAQAHRDTTMAGRTHGQHAVPITFGLKVASWMDELARCLDRLAFAERGLLSAQLGGAAGTLAALGEAAGAVRTEFCRRLQLAEPALAWHASRDRFRDLGHALNEIAASAERVAREIISLQSTEVSEVAEPTRDTSVGSSTMPQKRNPMVCEYIVANALLVRGATSVLTSSPAHAHERDMTGWAAEWLCVPQALIHTGSIVTKLCYVLEQLRVDELRMATNLALTRGQILAEAVMIELAQFLGRETAYDLVSSASKRATGEGRSLADALLDDPSVSACLSPADVARLMKPESYLGLAGEETDRAIMTLGRRVAASGASS